MQKNLAATIARKLMSLAGIIVNSAAALGAAAGGSQASRYLPRSHPDTRRGRVNRGRAVDRVVIDQWLLWRK
ncbi:MAG: hypothetical protein JWN94_935 [Betaproteobacteria bacterium]|nr:hypothetical protein [Betaproteobacteria bacterium]